MRRARRATEIAAPMVIPAVAPGDSFDEEGDDEDEGVGVVVVGEDSIIDDDAEEEEEEEEEVIANEEEVPAKEAEGVRGRSWSFENFIAETLACGVVAAVPFAGCGVVGDADGAAAVGFEIDFSVEDGLVVFLICEAGHVLDR
ncbi:hypothetical protein BPAE_0111g00110 [Botrytis paeoniae]|uniref:Uncharacterized protein n=1 Tax=Botrytis paeoniae TaxID=278948 RepID=A0A4Z1FM87_9HELO|nr:hypothetical protein BPAE_0111g00110 [Botrytis paeoniae]